jgi:hypothetical protein
VELLPHELLLVEVRRYLIEEAPPNARKRVLDLYSQQQRLSWSYRQASSWLADCLNPERPNRLPVEILPAIVEVLGHTRFLDVLHAIAATQERESRMDRFGPMRVRPRERERRETA